MATKKKTAPKKKKAKKANSLASQLDAAFHVSEAGFAFALVEQSAESPEGAIVAVMKTDVTFDEGAQGDFTLAQKKALYGVGLETITDLVDAGNADEGAIAEGKTYSAKLLTREEQLEWDAENEEEWKNSVTATPNFGGGDDDDSDYGDSGSDEDTEDGKGDDDFDDGEGLEESPEDSVFRIIDDDAEFIDPSDIEPVEAKKGI